MKILITGGSGQVGFELRRSLALFGNIVAPARQQLDLYDKDAVSRYLTEQQPDLIINAAAYTAVDNAESEPDQAHRINAELPALLADYAQAHTIWLVHYSSDYVYPGNGINPWQETCITAPLSVYGASKLAGDEAVVASGARHLIFRTSWVYGARGNNFMKTMLRLGAEREQLSVVADQVGAPTPARLIAEVTALAVSRLNRDPIEAGIYHLAPRGETNWHQFACAIFRQAREQEVPLTIDAERVEAITTANYPTPAQRPLNSRLCLDKLEQALELALPDWRHQLNLTLDEYLGSRR